MQRHLADPVRRKPPNHSTLLLARPRFGNLLETDVLPQTKALIGCSMIQWSCQLHGMSRMETVGFHVVAADIQSKHMNLKHVSNEAGQQNKVISCGQLVD